MIHSKSCYWIAIGLTLCAFVFVQAAGAVETNTSALSENGWFSDDTRADGTGSEAIGTNLVSDTLTDDPEATASGSPAHDGDILLQIPFVAPAPGTVPAGTHPHSVHMSIAAGVGAGKSQISHRKSDSRCPGRVVSSLALGAAWP